MSRKYSGASKAPRAVQNPSRIGLTLGILGNEALDRGEVERGRALIEASLYFSRQIGDKYGFVGSSGELARAAWLQHDLPRAVQLGAESLALAQELGMIPIVQWGLSALGWMTLQQNDAVRAQHYFAEALNVLRGSQRQDLIYGCLGGMAGVAVTQDQFERAATLWGKVNALRDFPPWPPLTQDIERLASEIPSHLSEADFGSHRSACGRPDRRAV